jgi:hypothetical protein
MDVLIFTLRETRRNITISQWSDSTEDNIELLMSTFVLDE